MLAALIALMGADAVHAGGRKPGSVLVYPIHRSGGGAFTMVSVTNTNLQPPIGVTLGGTTNVHFEYVNAYASPIDPLKPVSCVVANRTELLTPGDTVTHLVACHNPDALMNSGYLVVGARDPLLQTSAWSHNDLVGSEIVINEAGGVYSLAAIAFRSPQPSRSATDRDGDGQYDFDGIEYEGVADDLIVDSFIEGSMNSLALLNLTGGLGFDATVRAQVWNDNEFALSSLIRFRCWFEAPLTDLSLVFDGSFLAINTPDDPSETDVDCDGIGDFETGWVRIAGLEASSFTQSIPNPAVLGALTPGRNRMPDGGRLLWESPARQFNGDFFKLGTQDPEYPE